MNASTHTVTSWSDADVDRVRELGSIGAGSAANVFARLVGRTIRMEVPAVRGRTTRPLPHELEAWDTGVFFEVEGGPGGLLAVLFSGGARDAIVRLLVGGSRVAGAPLDEEAESALREVGNILASSVVSAIADVLGTRILPSIPTLALEGAGAALKELLAARFATPPVRIETEIFDGDGELRGLVVLVPEHA